MAANNYVNMSLLVPKAAYQLIVQLAEENGVRRGTMAVRLLEEALERGWGRTPDRTSTWEDGRKNVHGAPAASIPQLQKHNG